MNKERPQSTAIALWILRHFGLQNNREAITGDLLERLREGRSTGWLWREVLTAITVGGLEALRDRWWEVAFSFSGGVVYYFSEVAVLRSSLMSLWTVGLSLGWPLSAVYEYSYRSAVMSLLVLATLALALFIRRAFSWVSWVRMLRTFFVSFPLFTITNLAMVLWDRNLPHPLGNVLLAVPFFFALLISMWMSFPAHASSNAPKRREA